MNQTSFLKADNSWNYAEHTLDFQDVEGTFDYSSHKVVRRVENAVKSVKFLQTSPPCNHVTSLVNDPETLTIDDFFPPFISLTLVDSLFFCLNFSQELSGEILIHRISTQL